MRGTEQVFQDVTRKNSLGDEDDYKKSRDGHEGNARTCQIGMQGKGSREGATKVPPNAYQGYAQYRPLAIVSLLCFLLDRPLGYSLGLACHGRNTFERCLRITLHRFPVDLVRHTLRQIRRGVPNLGRRSDCTKKRH
jgi:hypothetical protein